MKFNILNKFDDHKKFLIRLPKIVQRMDYFKILYSPKEFSNELLYAISRACNHICLVTLYLESDQGGKRIIDALFRVKQIRPKIKIRILVDWHRAKRSRIGSSKEYTNVDWYVDLVNKYPNTEIAIYGIPININEVLGVLHLKGFIIDDQILYSGASLSDEYLHVNTKYRYDRYHIIRNRQLSNIMLDYIDKELLSSRVINKLGCESSLSKKLNKYRKNDIRLLRRNLRRVCYSYQGNATYNELAIAPLVGLGKNSELNQAIYHLICSSKNKIILCTPYFNMPNILVNTLIYLLHKGKNIEIIVGDKIANDFYIPSSKPFTLISVLPYLYELNLRYFLKKLQSYIDNKQLIVRMWKEGDNGYHVKGIWVDDEWQLLTGNNLNPRSLRFDLENALLIHDPCKMLLNQNNKELNTIRMHTSPIIHYTSLQHISHYPEKVGQFLNRICKLRFDRLINRIL
ncbi:CDP-diacylglycerol--serine O-phosphatidyltransferase [Blochmannia endosymbiont of Camponotus sp.]|uniref:CDP-diacylglycerol--serine O-phosphatidyltransferase n=1 Tax=Blochmannia endosymbiont of Camponotus sp. TaxID=700220 RepID=UPI0020249FCA|nr:CDP-diacylglycerol--serine O-phosphatidyltransferase [Blochmannia endosymbiont of Camponotus sp.]URJ29858.1 CDP-diacylglycerol--serine O-phosphatidyltransferase [Blochmannia endosymbiont of Camponotus sp.]